MKFSDSGERSLATWKERVHVCSAGCVLCLGTVCGVRAMQVPATVRAGTVEQKTGAPRAGSEAVAGRAAVTLKDGRLTVEASNSDLLQILRDVSEVSGMKINGTISNVRVFGVYGPRDPREVLSDLLEGLGYNFIMVGALHDGAPRELVVTARSGDVPPVATPATTPAALDARQRAEPEEEQFGPGAVRHVPPPPPEDPEVRVKQNLQRLQQMHQQQQKQQNAPQ